MTSTFACQLPFQAGLARSFIALHLSCPIAPGLRCLYSFLQRSWHTLASPCSIRNLLPCHATLRRLVTSGRLRTFSRCHVLQIRRLGVRISLASFSMILPFPFVSLPSSPPRLRDAFISRGSPQPSLLSCFASYSGSRYLQGASYPPGYGASASDSRSDGCDFEILWPHSRCFFLSHFPNFCRHASSCSCC